MRVIRTATMEDEAGQGDFTLAGPVPLSVDFDHIPGFGSSLIWSTDGEISVPGRGEDPTLSVSSLMPGPGGTRFGLLRIPPDSVYASPDFDPAAAGAEQAAKLPGLAELMDPENPGMHQTDTLDYVIVLDGEVTLDLGHGRERSFGKHEAIIQTGTRHAWRNKGDVPALLASVLIGVKRD